MGKAEALGGAKDKAEALDGDTDLALRSVTRVMPGYLARAVMPGRMKIRRFLWKETQVSARQRRMDRALWVETRMGERVLHWEWMGRLRGDMGRRVYEYHVLLALSLMDEVGEGGRVPGIESMVVLLSGGRGGAVAEEGEYRSSPGDRAFSGVRFRVEAVYKRTVDELVGRDNVFWLMFTPFAVDATAEKITGVLEELERRVDGKLFGEVAAAMLVLARSGYCKRGLDKPIQSVLEGRGEVVMDNFIYKAGFKAGVKSGREKGMEKGMEKGRLEYAREALRRVLSKRGFSLTSRQEERIDACSDLAMLDQWFEAALTARSAAAVFRGGAAGS